MPEPYLIFNQELQLASAFQEIKDEFKLEKSSGDMLNHVRMWGPVTHSILQRNVQHPESR